MTHVQEVVGSNHPDTGWAFFILICCKKYFLLEKTKNKPKRGWDGPLKKQQQ